MEQTLLTLFPQERPVYPDTPPGETTNWCSPFPGEASGAPPGRCCAGGKTYVRQCRVAAAELPAEDPVVSTRLTRRTLQRAFYLAAVDCLGTEPPWGMLSGVRPVKLPHPGHGGRGLSPPGGGHAAGPIPGLPLRRQLAMDCAQASLAVKRDLKPQEISLYVGIPFCPTRCAYCSFISASGSANRLIPDYLDALLAEIDAAGAAARRAGKTVRSVYLGGGPPPPWRPLSWPSCWTGSAGLSSWRRARSAPWRPAGRTPSPGKSSSPSGRAAATGSPSTPRPCPTLSWQPSAAATGPRISAGPMPWPGRPVWERSTWT